MLGRRYINAKKNVMLMNTMMQMNWDESCIHSKHKLHTQNAPDKKYKQIIKGDLIEGGGEWNDHTNLMI